MSEQCKVCVYEQGGWLNVAGGNVSLKWLAHCKKKLCLSLKVFVAGSV